MVPRWVLCLCYSNKNEYFMVRPAHRIWVIKTRRKNVNAIVSIPKWWWWWGEFIGHSKLRHLRMSIGVLWPNNMGIIKNDCRVRLGSHCVAVAQKGKADIEFRSDYDQTKRAHTRGNHREKLLSEQKTREWGDFPNRWTSGHLPTDSTAMNQWNAHWETFTYNVDQLDKW